MIFCSVVRWLVFCLANNISSSHLNARNALSGEERRAISNMLRLCLASTSKCARKRWNYWHWIPVAAHKFLFRILNVKFFFLLFLRSLLYQFVCSFSFSFFSSSLAPLFRQLKSLHVSNLWFSTARNVFFSFLSILRMKLFLCWWFHV